MKTSELSRYALSFCAAATMLAGCGGSQGLIGQSATGQPATAKQAGYNLAYPDRSSSEVLTASHVRLHTLDCSSGVTVAFRTEGKAEGPLPGSFAAKGEWGFRIFNTWYFDESFAITSGSSQVSGKISVVSEGTVPPMGLCGSDPYFGPDTLHYKTHSGYKGRVKIEIINGNDFNETLTDFRK
jgi:hypothetical protein